jgi:hypothetical protein
MPTIPIYIYILYNILIYIYIILFAVSFSSFSFSHFPPWFPLWVFQESPEMHYVWKAPFEETPETVPHSCRWASGGSVWKHGIFVISNELLGRNLDFPWFSMVFLLE